MARFKVIRYRHFWQALLVVLFDIILFTRTNAATITPFWLIVGFVLLAMTFYELIYGLMSLARFYGIKIRHKHGLSLYLSTVLGLIIALQSIGELTHQDVIVLLPLTTVGYIYGIYATSRAGNLDS